MRIICLDDHPAMLDTLVRELNIIAPGAAISAFQNAETALEFAEENGCDVLFSEIDLYGDDGLIFAEKMQALNPQLNIIFTTVCEEGERAKEVFRLHPSGYITKPYTQEQLAAELNTLRYPVKEPHAALCRSHSSAPAFRSSSAASFPSGSESESEPIPRHKPTYSRSYMFASMSASRVVPEPVPKVVPEPAPKVVPEPAPKVVPEPAPKVVAAPSLKADSEVPSEPFGAPQILPAAEPAKCPDAEGPNTRPMSSKELRRLSRAELLEMLITQTKENEDLKVQLRETEQKLECRALSIENAGSIAQAAMQINGVFEAAQRAADQYLENVRVQSQNLTLREKEYADRAEQILATARAKCAALESDTAKKCEEMLRTAEEETQARWSDLHERMESYLKEHEQLRSLLGLHK